VLGIVRSHGGAVKVTSEPDQGTTVQVFLPLVEMADAPADAPAAAAAAAAWHSEGLALVVDEEALIVSLTRKILSQHGMEVLSADEWRGGLEVARGRSADLRLVLLDADRLPPDAAEVPQAFRALVPGVPLLFWGGHLREDLGRCFRSLSRSAFLNKPFSPTGLLAKAHELLG
jgi:DNA-binding NtrC family response regulator